MNTQQLAARFTGKRQSGYGHFQIGFFVRGKELEATTTNTMALDRIYDENEGIDRGKFYSTKKQAYMALWNETKRANSISKSL